MIYIREEEGKARLAWQCGKFGMCVRVGGNGGYVFVMVCRRGVNEEIEVHISRCIAEFQGTRGTSHHLTCMGNCQTF